MRTKNIRTAAFIVVLIFLGLVISGCATFEPTSPQKAIRERVEKLMDAKMNNDWATVYDLLSPAYREKVSKDGFVQKSRGLMFTGYTIDSIEIKPSGDKAVVELTYSVNMRGFEFKDNPETQQWVKKGWHWYMDLEPKSAEKNLPSKNQLN
jgi:uncharacterized protein YceK